MSYRTLAVKLVEGRVHPRDAEPLPANANALLTILEGEAATANPSPSPDAGLSRFLSQRDFSLTAAQFRESMESDFWEQ